MQLKLKCSSVGIEKKVKSQSFIRDYALNLYWGREVYLYTFLTRKSG